MKTKQIFLKRKIKNLQEATFMKCLDCCCCQPKEIFLCEIRGCPLWDLRPEKLEGAYTLIRKLKQKNPDLYVAIK